MVSQQFPRGVAPRLAREALDRPVELAELVPAFGHEARAAAFHLVKRRVVQRFPGGMSGCINRMSPKLTPALRSRASRK